MTFAYVFVSILALARAARDLGLKRPVMREEPVLQIRKGRHILFESLVPRYIENDTMIASGGIDGLASMVSSRAMIFLTVGVNRLVDDYHRRKWLR